MTKVHSTATSVSRKPAKPRPDFPLSAHNSGRWYKKIRGRFYYFGPWDDPEGAEEKYLAEKGDLEEGRTPRTASDPKRLTVFTLCEKYLSAKKVKRDIGELSPRSLLDYATTCRLLIKAFGKNRLVSDLRPEDFERLRAMIAKKCGVVRRGNEIVRVRGVFKYGFDSELMDRPARFGPEFKKPNRKTMRKHRQAQGKKMFEAAEIRKMLDAAGQPLKAMILFGINCGLGNSDCGLLPLSALDLDRGWLTYPRPKTGVERRCWLWPETVEAIREWLTVRPEPKDPAHKGLVFITKQRGSWHKDTPDGPVSKEMRKLLDSLGMNGHRNFYALRHTFETVAGETKDQVAVDHVMGHARDDMASIYRERISDERLKAVAQFVRAWLFGSVE